MFALLFFITISILSVNTEKLITYRVPISNSIKSFLGYPKENLLNFTELAEQNGYETETHSITTSDGYISYLFRVNGPRCRGRLRAPPVVLVHGLLQVADVWLDAGNDSLSYLLAEECYDLWFGNTRGTYYSRAHKTLNPDKDAEFWNYSIDEVGLYDIPNIIDNVLRLTSSPKVNYIGFSQGGGSAVIAMSTYPKYNRKVNLFIGLAPATQMKNCKSVGLKLVTKLVALGEKIIRKFGLLEMLFKNSIVQSLLEFICQVPGVVTKSICLLTLTVSDSYDPGSITDHSLRRLFAHFPAGVSLQMLIHYHQSIVKGGFSKYDYGVVQNLKKYGSLKPPEFDVKKVTAPSVLITGLNDHIVAAEDVKWLSKRLPNLLEFVVMNNTFWDHLDVHYSSYIPNSLFVKVNEYLHKYSDES